MSSPTRTDIVTRARGGDTAAFTAFVAEYKPMVYRWAMGLVIDGDEAEDVAQEAFVLVYQRLGSFRGEGSFDGWMYRIVRRVAEGRRRRTTRRARLDRTPAARPTDEVYTTDPGGRVDRELLLAQIYESMRELPPRQREVFDLCDLQGRTPAEIAEMLGMKAVSVRANLFKARAAIRRKILVTHPRYAAEAR